MKLRHTLAYSSGNFANTLALQVFVLLAQAFYVKDIGLSVGLVGTVWVLYGFWNVVNDPIAGALSDGTRSRLGRRRPYLLFGAVPLGVAFALVWNPPREAGSMVVWLLVGLFLFDAIYSLVTVPYNAMFPALAATPQARARLAAARESVAVVALLMAFILGPILAEELGYQMMGLVIGAIVAVTYLLPVWSGPDQATDKDVVPGALQPSMRSALRNSKFRMYVGANIAKELVFVLLASTLPFWSTDVLGLAEGGQLFGVTLGRGDTQAVLLGVPFVLALPFLLLWRSVMPRLGAARSWALSFLVLVPALAVMFVADDLGTGLLGTALIAPGLAGLQMLPIILLSEVVDDDERRTGFRREGTFFGLNGALTKVAFIFQGAMFGGVLALTGYQEGRDVVQTDSAVFGVRLLMTVGPLLACITGAGLLALYTVRTRAARHAPEPAGTR